MTPPLPFLAGYAQPLLDQVRQLLADGALGDRLQRRYPEAHAIRTDGALYEHASALKARYLRNAPALSKVVYEGRLQIDQRALGTLTAVSRVQGGRLTAKRELRVAAAEVEVFYDEATGQSARFVASGAAIAIVDARGALGEGQEAVRAIADAAEANAAARTAATLSSPTPPST